MKQINFRVSEDEYRYFENVAKLLGKTVPELVKEFGMKGLREASVDLALDSYKNDKIGLKQAWHMTGLSFHEFTGLLMSRGIDPPSNPARLDRSIDSVRSVRFEDLYPGRSKEELRKLIKVPGDRS
jgi:predicted HTH domain antitoxin